MHHYPDFPNVLVFTSYISIDQLIRQPSKPLIMGIRQLSTR